MLDNTYLVPEDQMTREWYYKLMGEVFGPVADKDFATLMSNGTIQGDTHVKCGREGEWTTADHYAGAIRRSTVPDRPSIAAPSVDDLQDAAKRLHTEEVVVQRSVRGTRPTEGQRPVLPARTRTKISRRTILAVVVVATVAVLPLASRTYFSLTAESRSRNRLWAKAKELVLNQLKAPATAKFPEFHEAKITGPIRSASKTRSRGGPLLLTSMLKTPTGR